MPSPGSAISSKNFRKANRLNHEIELSARLLLDAKNYQIVPIHLFLVGITFSEGGVAVSETIIVGGLTTIYYSVII
jgi:hypothetical protein